MSQKMGTHYVREIVELFRNVAAEDSAAGVKDKLNSLANELEPLATKLYFKTQKGNEEMEKLAGELGDLKEKIDGCADENAAKAYCEPYFELLDKTIQHVKTMKVRMT